MKYQIHPDYQITDRIPLAVSQNLLRKCKIPEQIEIREISIPSADPDTQLLSYLYIPTHIDAPLPLILDIHGGGFTGGDALMDRNRDINLALNVPCIVLAINYRLAPKHPYPAALMDCYAAWNWLHQNAEKLGGDPEQMGLFGTSAGGNLCAGLAFYVRDHGGPKISLNAINVPVLSMGTSLSKDQMRYDAPVLSDSKGHNSFRVYLPDLNGQYPPYYAVPNAAFDFIGLPPTLIIAAEYDPLREDALLYAKNLRAADVPVELYLMPRVGHGFGMVADAPMTKWIWQGIALSFRREFKISSSKPLYTTL